MRKRIGGESVIESVANLFLYFYDYIFYQWTNNISNATDKQWWSSKGRDREKCPGGGSTKKSWYGRSRMVKLSVLL